MKIELTKVLNTIDSCVHANQLLNIKNWIGHVAKSQEFTCEEYEKMYDSWNKKLRILNITRGLDEK